MRFRLVASPGAETTDGIATGASGGAAGSPGFGLAAGIVALVALVAFALLATSRD